MMLTGKQRIVKELKKYWKEEPIVLDLDDHSFLANREKSKMTYHFECSGDSGWFVYYDSRMLNGDKQEMLQLIADRYSEIVHYLDELNFALAKEIQSYELQIYIKNVVRIQKNLMTIRNLFSDVRIDGHMIRFKLNNEVEGYIAYVLSARKWEMHLNAFFDQYNEPISNEARVVYLHINKIVKAINKENGLSTAKV